MLKVSQDVEDYFGAFRDAFTGLAEIAETESKSRMKTGLLYNELSTQLSRLQHSFECWHKKCLFNESFKYNRKESGFPTFKAVLELQRDAERREEHLLDIPTPRQIRAEMIDLMLKYKQFPGALQKTMAERDYFESLGEKEIFPSFTAPRTLDHSVDHETKRTSYVVTWSTYDGSANLPIVYLAVIEDSTEGLPALPIRGPWSRDDDWLKQHHYNGLPNLMLRQEFREFTENHSGYGLNLTTIATRMDEAFPNLHPKQLRRFVLGPFYAGRLTDHNERVQSLLDAVTDTSNNWLLTWTMQELHSLREQPGEKGFWSTGPSKQIFYVNTDDVDCAAQGVSALEQYALVPHGAYQATFAKGMVDDVFKQHRCYVASGEHILRHV